MRFCIKKEVQKDGKIICTPMVKESGLGAIFSPWQQIVKINDSLYFVMECDIEVPTQTEEECKEYIEGYKKQLELQGSTEIIETKIIEVV